MPDQIHADPKSGQWFAHRSDCNYVRADLHATLAAEVEQLRKERDEIAQRCRIAVADRIGHKLRAEKAEAEVERLRQSLSDSAARENYLRREKAHLEACNEDLIEQQLTTRAEASAAVKVKALLEEIGTKSLALRKGGPDPMDLHELSDALEEAIDLAMQAHDILTTEPAAPSLPVDRDTLGRMVREAWVRWALTQPNPKPSWLLPYSELSEPDKEADRQIGEAIAKWTLIHSDAARFSPAAPQEAEAVAYCEPEVLAKLRAGKAANHVDLSRRRGNVFTEPLYTSPPAQAVTEAQVEAAYAELCRRLSFHPSRDQVRAALAAAQEASHDAA